MNLKKCLIGLAALSLSFVVSVSAQETNWFEGEVGSSIGASRDYYNSPALLSWNNYMGDWNDKNGVEQGDVSYAQAEILDDDIVKRVEWNVTGLVSKWVNSQLPNKGFFLRVLNGGTYKFHAKESLDTGKRPALVVNSDTGTIILSVEADTYLSPSTYKSMGLLEELVIASNKPVLLRFDLRGITNITSATLQLYSNAQSGGAGSIGVFNSSQGHDMPDLVPQFGIASEYSMDAGLSSHPDVVFVENFEGDNWVQNWSNVNGNYSVVTEDSNLMLEPVFGKTLRVKFPEGANNAINAQYNFQEETGSEPEEMYFRYYARLGNDWNQTVEGGKLPGLSGTYGLAGWGGRRSNGTNGWSARGAFIKTTSINNPLISRTGIGNYIYHAEMEGNFGDIKIWQNDYLGYLEKNRWYSIEQQVKLNTPGQNDGVLRAWIDGKLAFEITSVRFRDVSKLKIEKLWFNIYHGGTAKSPYDQHIFVDNIVLAKRYIGPISGVTGGVVPSTPINLNLNKILK